MSVSASVVIAAYNEAARLRATLDAVWRTLRSDGDADWELVLVDDGSTDATGAVLQEFAVAVNQGVTIVAHASNLGLREAMRSGCLAATSETIVFLDADLSYAPEVALRLLQAKVATGADVALASPYMTGGRVANVPFDRLLASRVANWLLCACAGGRVQTFTGMVRAYDAQWLRHLFSQRPVGEFNAWAVAASVAAHKRIVEIPATLAWPSGRAVGRGAMPFAKVRERAGLVLRTARVVARACRGAKPRETGTLVLSGEPRVPYSLIPGATYN